MRDVEDISDDQLQAWMDGEAGDDTERISEYVEFHPNARQRLTKLAEARETLRELIDQGLGSIDPLAGMAAIRECIRRDEQGRLSERLRLWWSTVWRFHRGAWVGMVLAALAGALAAPGLLWLLGAGFAESRPVEGVAVENAAEEQGDSMYAPVGVGIESLDIGGNRAARVLESGETMLIWVDGDEDWNNEGVDDTPDKDR